MGGVEIIDESMKPLTALTSCDKSQQLRHKSTRKYVRSLGRIERIFEGSMLARIHAEHISFAGERINCAINQFIA